MNKILGIGNALIDVLVKIEDDKILKELNLIKGGMTLINENVFNNLTNHIKQLKKTEVTGGSAANSIVGLSKLGVKTGFIGQIGKDYYGKKFKDELISNHITPHLSEINTPSGVATTFISKDGERTFGTFLGAGSLLNKGVLQDNIIRDYKIFYIEGYLVQDHELIMNAVDIAKKNGLKVAIDMASFNIVKENLEFLKEIISKKIDFIFANEEESYALTQQEPLEAITTLSKDVNTVIIKIGAEGSIIQEAETQLHIPTNKGIKCVDSTGAGDLYAAGFLYGINQGYPLKRCGEIGTLLAEEVIQVIGAKIPEERWNMILNQI